MDERDFSVVDLSNKGLETMPTSVLMNAAFVQSLDLSGNHFTDMSKHMSLSKFTNVTSLQLKYCGLSELPEELLYLHKLEKFSLCRNHLAQGLSPFISKLKALKDLDIGCCELTHLPEELCTLEKLEKLSLSNNDFAQGLSSSIGKFKALKDLDVAFCDLEHLPEELWTLEKLEKLSISGNILVQGLSPSISKLKALKELDIELCGLIHLPKELWTLEKLENLSLMGNKIALGLSPSISKLKALKELLVAHCELKHLPEELWTLEKLETLSLYRNHLTQGLSPSISKLKALKDLDIGFCKLKHLPEELWTLEKLEKLSFGGTILVQGLSPSISKLKELKELNMEYCGLAHLPKELWTLEKLQKLKLRNNCLVKFPADAVYQPNLHWLDLSNDPVSTGEGEENRIKELPDTLKDCYIKDLGLHGNPIVRPPKAIWEQGVQAIKLYFKEVTSGEQKELCVDTINIIGEIEAGKTSIARSLVEGKPIRAAPDDRTRVMQRLPANFTRSSSDSPVYLNDFGGHPIYRSIIPLFLPCIGLAILVYNLMAPDWSDQENKVKRWLLTAIARSTKIRLVVVGTRSDLVGSYENAPELKTKMKRFLLDVVHKLKSDVKKHIKYLTFQKKADDYPRKSSLEKSLRDLKSLEKKLEEAVFSFATVSCDAVSEDFDQFYALVRDNIKQLEIIPARWWQVMEDILKVDHSGFPRRTMEQVKDVYRKYITDDPQCGDLPVILNYLANCSQIIWVENDPRLRDSIFHSPQGIVDICTKILDHRVVEDHADYQAAQVATGIRSGLGHDCTPRLQPKSKEAEKIYIDRYKEGILEGKLLKKLLCQYEEGEISEVVAFMERFDLLSEIKLTEATETQDLTANLESIEKRSFVITSNLPKEEPLKSKTYTEEYRKRSSSSVFVSLSFFGCIIPLAFFETSLSSILSVAKKHCDGRHAAVPWKYGLCIRFENLVLLVKYHEDKEEVTFAAHSVDSEQNPWFLLCPVLKRLQENISASWPGVVPEWQIMCLGCCWLKERGRARQKIARSPISFDKLISRFQEGSRRKPELQVFEDCIHRVPRCLCHALSQDSFTDEEQKQIAQFYEHLKESLTEDEMDLPPYDMPSSPHGTCVIINNVEFNYKHPCCRCFNQSDIRHGSDYDAVRLFRIFDGFDYSVDYKENLKASDMMQFLTAWSKKDHSQFDSFVCVILSHGDKDVVFGCDYGEVPISGLMELFYADKCPSLGGKPKLFFIQACRGNMRDRGIPVQYPVAANAKRLDGRQKQPQPQKVLVTADVLKSYSTVLGYVCHRDPLEGSTYIQTLCDVLERNSEREDVSTMLVMVNNEVQKKENQVPVYENALSRKLYFRRRKQPPNVVRQDSAGYETVTNNVRSREKQVPPIEAHSQTKLLRRRR